MLIIEVLKMVPAMQFTRSAPLDSITIIQFNSLF
jgi:hypothetical protein